MEFSNSYFEELGKSAGVTKLCTDAAEKVAAAARASAPVVSGDYRDSIHVEVRASNKRNVALVVADDWKALLIEAQTGNLVRALKTAKKS